MRKIRKNIRNLRKTLCDADNKNKLLQVVFFFTPNYYIVDSQLNKRNHCYGPQKRENNYFFKTHLEE